MTGADQLNAVLDALAANPMSAEFARFAGRTPREGDTWTEEAREVVDRDGVLVSVRTCWSYEAGRWEGHVAVTRGVPWAR